MPGMRWSVGGVDRQNPGVLAFYYPQFHRLPLNDEHFGEGFTEWSVVDRAIPWFDGHDQPRRPGELGRYDLTDPEVWERQVELAIQGGLSGFCFYYYWFGPGEQLLEAPLQTAQSSPADFPRCLMWANHDWTRVWDGDPDTVTMSMSYEPGHGAAFVDSCSDVLGDDRYIRIDGRPLLLIYDIDAPPDLELLIGEMRARAVEVGLGDLFVCGVQRGRVSERARSSALDAMCEFPPTGYHDDRFLVSEPPPGLREGFRGRILDYERVAAASVDGRHLDPEVDWFRTVVPDWDNTGRRLAHADPWLFVNADPQVFRRWLAALLSQARSGECLPLVFVNAWNEWGEGAYLEPDRSMGGARLEAVAAATVDLVGIASAGQYPKPWGSVGGQPERTVASATAEPLQGSRPATLWIEQAGFACAPITEQVSLEGRWHRFRGFLVSPDLRDGSVPIRLALVGESPFHAMATPGDRHDLLAKHGHWLNDANVAGAGFDAWIDLTSLMPGSYELTVERGDFAGSLGVAVVRVVGGSASR